MKITKLPKRDEMTYFNVQYFQNEGGKGSAKHVIQVTYSTNPDPYKAKNLAIFQRKVRFDLRTENKEINRMVKKHLGEELGAMVKENFKKLLKQDKILAFFGFRKVQYALDHKFKQGAFYHKRAIDPETYVIFYLNESNEVKLAFCWNGETIETNLVWHQMPVKPGQSVAYSFVVNGPSDNELKDHIEKMKNGELEQDSNPDVNVDDFYSPDSGKPTTVNRRDEDEVQEANASEKVEGRKEFGPSENARTEHGVAKASRGTRFSEPGYHDQSQTVAAKQRSNKATKQNARKSKGRQYNRGACSAGNELVAETFETPFADEPHKDIGGLGTTFSF